MVGVELKKQETPPIFWFIKDPNQTGYDDKANAFIFDESSALSPFAKSIGFKITDKIVALDDKTINIQNIQDFVNYSKTIKEGQNVTVTILRDNKKMELKGKAILDKMTMETLQFKANPTPEEKKLQDQWLTGKK
ncbi:MAG: PDZ domain-containing protein [Chryseobacterium taeanense]